jgi:DNA-binding MarR family transcriptional regulator
MTSASRSSRPLPDPGAGSGDAADRGPLLGALLRRCHQALVAEIARDLAAAGHEQFQPQYNAVVRPLWDNPAGVRSSELAAAARITKQSMGAIVDQLQEAGYVERVDDPDDARAKLVRLTKRGREAGRVARAAVRRVEADWARRVGAGRLAALRKSLTDLLASLELEA